MNKEKKAKLALTIICFFTGVYLATNTLIAYIVQSYDYLPAAKVQSLLTVPALIGLFVAFVTGPIAVKVNKKLLLIISVAFVFVYFVIFAFVGPNGPFSLLLVAACLVGITGGSAQTLLNSLVSDYIAPERQASCIAMNLAMSNVGYGAINMVMGKIAAANGGTTWNRAYYLGFLILAGIIAFAIIMPNKPDVAVVQPQESLKTDDAAPESDAKKKFPLKVCSIVLIAALYTICYCAYMYSISAYVITEYQLGSSVQAAMATTICTLIGVIVGFTYTFWNRLFKKWLPTVGYICMGLGFVSMVAIHTNLAGAYIGSLLYGFGFNLQASYVMSKMMSSVSPKAAPVAMSIYMGTANMISYFGISILNFGGNLFGGGVTGSLLVGVCAAVLCTVLSLFVFTFEKASATEQKTA